MLFRSYQNLLAAQQSYQLAVVTLVQAQSGRLGDTAALYQALGGGWWNRKDDAAEKKDAASDKSDLNKTSVAQQTAATNGVSKQ